MKHTYAPNCPWLAYSIERFYNCKYNINGEIYWFTGEWGSKFILDIQKICLWY